MQLVAVLLLAGESSVDHQVSIGISIIGNLIAL